MIAISPDADTALVTALSFIVIGDFYLLGSERKRLNIRLIGLQGFFLGIMPLLVFDGSNSGDLHIWMTVVIFVIIKGGLLPLLLWRTYKKLPPLPPYVSYIGNTISVLLGLAAFIFSLWLNSRMGIAANPLFSQIFPTAFATIFTGLLLIISRRMALSQIFGYLVMENGIYLLGVPMARESVGWLEFSILMDVLVAAFVMGIALNHINRVFHSIDVARFSSLRD